MSRSPWPPASSLVSTSAASTATCGAALARPRGRGRRRGRDGGARSSPAVRAGGDAALRDLTERFDGCRLDDAGRRREPSARPRSARIDPDCAPRSSSPATRSSPGTRRSASKEARPRAVGRPGAGAGRAGRPGRLLRARRPGAARVVGADDRGPGAGRRRADGRAVHAAAARRHACTTRSSRPPRSPRSTRCTGSAARRRSPRWRTAPRSIAAVDVIVGPGQRVRRGGEAPGRGRRRHRRLRGSVGGRDRRRRHRRSRCSSRPTCSRRPSTVPAARSRVITWDEDVADAVDARARRAARERGPTRGRRGDAAQPAAASCSSTDPSRRSTPRTRSRPSTSSSCAPTPTLLVPLVRNAGAVFVGRRRVGGDRRLRRGREPRAADRRAPRASPSALARRRLPEARARRVARRRARWRELAPFVHDARRSRGPDRARRRDPPARGPVVSARRDRRPRPAARRPARARGLPLAAGRRRRAPQHEREPVRAARRVRRRAGPTRSRDVDWHRYPDRGARRAARRARRVPRSAAGRGCSARTAATRCCRRCCSPTAGPGGAR